VGFGCLIAVGLNFQKTKFIYLYKIFYLKKFKVGASNTTIFLIFENKIKRYKKDKNN
jgi:hypothetical protein